jgi:adenylate cyclase
MREAEAAQLLVGIKRRLAWAAVVANLLGAIDVFVFGVLLLPVNADGVDRAHTVLVNGIVFVPYMAATLTAGSIVSFRQLGRVEAWLGSGRLPTPEERRHTLRLALLHGRISAFFWGLGTVVFTGLNIVVATPIAVALPPLLVLGGVTASTVNYLLSERALRPLVARALASGLPERPMGLGVSGRVTVVWLAATGVPLLGIAATAAAGLLSDEIDRTLLAAAILFLAGVAALVGFTSARMSARALAEPLAAVRHALERVERGDLSAEVEVDDGSELGLVEAGFNRMAAGLRERERMRDVFGRHVGRDVARAALDGEVRLGGEVRDVGVLFVDLIGSTALAGRLEPERVVGLLNEFFAIVVAVTEAHGGLVNKFEGDGALAVFGAPMNRDDPAGAALAAAREMRARLLDELPAADAALGVSAGRAVAGNVGAEERFEYTVIGDPVNEASRLCDLAKGRPERVVASDAAVERADPRESARWTVGEATVLRGRSASTRIATVGSPS